MDASIIHADIFFFVATVALIVFVAIVAIAGFYVISTLRNIREISRVLKRGAENAEGTVKEIYQGIEESAVFRFIFGKKKNKKPRAHKTSGN
jgi:hypothetical protein